jgi:hypothetical protein
MTKKIPWILCGSNVLAHVLEVNPENCGFRVSYRHWKNVLRAVPYLYTYTVTVMDRNILSGSENAYCWL